MNREDSVLDEIDRLVDESLERGERNRDSFRGNQYVAELPCPWCHEGWHFLKITQRMVEMRNGSYAQDEFGVGIIDPAYRLADDDSMIVCPGSEYHGPPSMISVPMGAMQVQDIRAWDKQGRERLRSIEERTAYYTGNVEQNETLGRDGRHSDPTLRTYRFYGPFDGWLVAIDQEVEWNVVPIDPTVPVSMPWNQRRERGGVTTTVTFDLEGPISNPPDLRRWFILNEAHVRTVTITSEGTHYEVSPVVFKVSGFSSFQSEGSDSPDWAEFTTTEDLSKIPWFASMWSWSGTDQQVELRPHRPGNEIDYEIIDEAFEFTEEGIHNAIYGGTPAGEREAQEEAYRELQRRSQVFFSTAEDPTARDRSASVEDAPREGEEAADAVDHAGHETTDEAEGER